MLHIQKYDEIDFNKIVAGTAEKKEFSVKKSDGKEEKGSYHLINIQYELTDSTTDFVFRLPVCRFWPMSEDKSKDSLGLILDRQNPECEAMTTFFKNIREISLRAVWANKTTLKVQARQADECRALVKDPIYCKYDDSGRPQGSGTVYLSLIAGSPTTNSTIFVGPDEKVYPRSRFMGYNIEGSPVVKFESIYCGQKYSQRLKILQLNLTKIKKLNSSSLDPTFKIDDPLLIDQFHNELNNSSQEEKSTTSPPIVPLSDGEAALQVFDYLADLNKPIVTPLTTKN